MGRYFLLLFLYLAFSSAWSMTYLVWFTVLVSCEFWPTFVMDICAPALRWDKTFNWASVILYISYKKNNIFKNFGDLQKSAPISLSQYSQFVFIYLLNQYRLSWTLQEKNFKFPYLIKKLRKLIILTTSDCLKLLIMS